MPAPSTNGASRAEASGALPADGTPPSPGARALAELQRAAGLGGTLSDDAARVLGVALDGLLLGLRQRLRSAVTGLVANLVLALAGAAGLVLLGVGAGGWLAARLGLGTWGTLVCVGLALVLVAGAAASTACVLHRRRQARQQARRLAARAALAGSARDLAAALASAADPRPWVDRYPLGSLGAVLATGFVVGGAGARRTPPTTTRAPVDGPQARSAPGLTERLLQALAPAGLDLLESILRRDGPAEDEEA